MFKKEVNLFAKWGLLFGVVLIGTLAILAKYGVLK